ncbi:hypothetical protein BZA05DRAFT_445465 [Tricharina praecox]|uniref:uncharacterized protein n=1 Tax=Tricharina praecox TaxID=43433 RepID=UPI002220410B|nr:uncharacterized protein BZA05DRAFT_445465 [Tricharina praecox]KAI5850627.1 hypothetical protein BZA05DRAFT_445465 [Tricharina praecox]
MANMDYDWDNLIPFEPLVSKSQQFPAAFILMALGICLTGFFSLNKSIAIAPLLAIPASLSFAFGAVFLICAVGVYV